MNAVLRPRLLLSVTIAFAVTGCGLSSPYVKLPSETERTKACSEQACSIESAIGYSRQVDARYRAVLDQYAKLRTGTGAALLGIGAATLGFAAVKAHRDVFTTLGFAGATTYGFEKFYENPPREALFHQTREALRCAESEAGKLRLSPGTRNEMNRLMSLLESWPSSVAAAETHRAELSTRLTKAENAAVAARSKKDDNAQGRAVIDKTAIQKRIDQLDELHTLIAAARADATTARVAAVRRLDQDNTAGFRLMQVVDSIVTATDREAAKTVPDPSSVFAIIGDLAGVAERFLPSADAVKGLLDKSKVFGPQSDSKLALEDELKKFLDEVDRDISVAKSDIENFASTTKSLLEFAGKVTDDAYKPMEACRIAGLGDLSLTPKELSVTEKTATTFSIDADGGKPPYSASISGVQTQAITFTPPRFDESRFVVTVTDKLVAAKYEIAIADATGRRAKFTLTATSSSGGGNSAGGGNGVAGGSATGSPAGAGTQPPFDAFVNLKTAAIGGKQYRISDAEMQTGGRLAVAVDPEPATAADRTAVRKALEGVKSKTGETLKGIATNAGYSIILKD